MNSKEFKSLLAQTFQTMQSLTRTKGEEYKGAEDEQLGNFYRGANDASVSPHVVWLIFFNKHFDAIKAFVRNGKVLSQEHIEGRIDDAILYLVLLKALIRDEDAKKRTAIRPLCEYKRVMIGGVLRPCSFAKDHAGPCSFEDE